MKNIFTGSFDPPTLGHLSIIERGADLLGSLTVVVCDNMSKKHMFEHDERFKMIVNMVKHLPNVSIMSLEPGKMLSHHIVNHDVRVLVRGLRNGIDLEYERTIEDFVKEYGVEEVVYLLNEPALANISSSAARNHLMVMQQAGSLTASIYKYLPEPVVQCILETKFWYK